MPCSLRSVSSAVAVGVYFICGFAWQGYIGAPAHTDSSPRARWNWLARGPFFLRGMELDGSPLSLAAWLQIFSVGLAALIPLGAGLDRWRLSAACASTALLAGWTYPLFAHWVWGGGWLAQLGIERRLWAAASSMPEAAARFRSWAASPRWPSPGFSARAAASIRSKECPPPSPATTPC